MWIIIVCSSASQSFVEKKERWGWRGKFVVKGFTRKGYDNSHEKLWR